MTKREIELLRNLEKKEKNKMKLSNVGANLSVFRPSRLFVLTALILSGCAIADFTPYSGGQQNWPTAPGAFVKTAYAVPAYLGYPNRPYNVIGYLDATTAPIRRRGVVAFGARRAKELGAEAIIVLQQGAEYAGTVGTANSFTSANVSGSFIGNTYTGTGYATTTGNSVAVPLFFGKASIIMIKWR
jgi:hypothetical protein